MKISAIVYLVGIALLGLSYYFIRDFLDNDILFLVLGFIYLYLLRALSLYLESKFARRKK